MQIWSPWTNLCGRWTRAAVGSLSSGAAFALVLLTSPGCKLPEQLHSRQRLEFGRILVLPGIEGGNVLSRRIALGLADGGVRSAIEIHDWTLGLPAFPVNLMYLERNQRVAQELAQHLVDYRAAHPERPIHLVGHSGGAGIIVFALEALPDGFTVDGAVLLGAALSPDYNLAPALRHVRSGLITFYSQRDVGFLKAGTSVFGGMDRSYGVSAGAVGFNAPANIMPEERRLYARKLRQIAWSERIREYGASGGHLGWASRSFSRQYLAPIVKRNEAAFTAQPAHPPATQPATELPAAQGSTSAD